MLSKSDTTQFGSTKAWIFVGILAGGHTLYHWVVQGFIVVLPEVQHHFFFEQYWGRVDSYGKGSVNRISVLTRRNTV